MVCSLFSAVLCTLAAECRLDFPPTNCLAGDNDSVAAAAVHAPFQGSAEARRVGGDPPYEFIHLTGLATHLGSLEGMRTVRNMGRTTVATTVLVGVGGDSISIYSEITWDKHFVKASGFYVVTGGTGRFQGATGDGVETVGPFDPAITARVLTWEGVIAFQ